MQIIPVIDLKDEKAVAAHRGQRHRYRPQASPLCRNGEPFALLARLSRTYHTIYLADINALQNDRAQGALLGRIRRRFPRTDFWLDVGGRGGGIGGFRRVVGSESRRKGGDLHPGAMLSLDYKNRRLLGNAPPIHRRPRKLLAINLGDVGGGGLDFPHLQSLARQNSGRKLVVGGGIGNLCHLRLLKKRGFNGVLVATILHRSPLAPGLLAKSF